MINKKTYIIIVLISILFAGNITTMRAENIKPTAEAEIMTESLEPNRENDFSRTMNQEVETFNSEYNDFTKQQLMNVRAMPPASIHSLFPDANLAEVIRIELNKVAVTDIITQAELDTITTLSADNKGITSLQGMEYLTTLSLLSLNNNQISDLTPVSGLTLLTMIQVRNNLVSDLSPLVNLTLLDYLDLTNNQLQDIAELAGLSLLGRLYLTNNQISTLTPLTNLQQLYYLDASDNQISDLSPLSGLTNLQYLNLARNQITDITPLEHLNLLTSLYLYENQISDANPIANLLNLQNLFLYSNHISDITPFVGLVSLERLDLYDNHISDIRGFANASFPNLVEAYLSEQTIMEQTIQTHSVINIENQIFDNLGNYVTPTSISHGGTYQEPILTWVNLLATQSSVTYNFSQPITLGPLSIVFSGIVAQPLSEAYSLIYMVDDQIYHQVQLAPGTIFEAPAIPVKTGYTFLGWYTESGVLWDFMTSTMPTQNLTLTAKFRSNLIPPLENTQDEIIDGSKLVNTGDHIQEIMGIGSALLMMSVITLFWRKRYI